MTSSDSEQFFLIMTRSFWFIGFSLKLFFILFLGWKNPLLFQTLYIFLLSNLISFTVWLNKNKHIQYLNLQKKLLSLLPEHISLSEKKHYDQALDKIIARIEPHEPNLGRQQKIFWLRLLLNQIFTSIIYAVLCYFQHFQILNIYLVVGILMSVIWHLLVIQRQAKFRSEIETYISNNLPH